METELDLGKNFELNKIFNDCVFFFLELLPQSMGQEIVWREIIFQEVGYLSA